MSLQHGPFSACTPFLTDLFANQAWAFPYAFILPSLVISWGGGADATVVGLFVPSAPACAWFWMYAPSTLPWVVAGPTQSYARVGLAEPSLRWAVPATCLFAVPWPCLPDLPGPSSTPGIAFQRHIILTIDGMAWLQNPRHQHFDSPSVATNSSRHLFPPTVWDLPNCMAPAAWLLALRFGTAEAFLTWVTLTAGSLLCHFINGLQ